MCEKGRVEEKEFYLVGVVGGTLEFWVCRIGVNMCVCVCVCVYLRRRARKLLISRYSQWNFVVKCRRGS